MQKKSFLKLRLILISILFWMIGGFILAGYFYYSWQSSVEKQEIISRKFAKDNKIAYQPAENKFELQFDFAPEPFRSKLLEIQSNIGGLATEIIFSLILSVFAGISTGWKIGSQLYK